MPFTPISGGMGPGPSTQGPWGGDFSGQLTSMLAPYQQIAQRAFSPYATMSPNSWLARQHPQLAGFLDNAFLAAGMTPAPTGPEGIGGGISRLMQGQIGAQQFRRQQMLQGAMLPYQMAMTQLQAQDVMSQIREREAMAPYYRSRAEWYEGRLEQAEQPRFVPGGIKTDDAGQNWHEIFDPTTGRVRNFNPDTQKYADELPADKQPTFAKSQRQTRMATPGGLMGEIIDMRMSSDPAVRARGAQMATMYAGMTGAAAGARTGAEQMAPHPYTDLKTFTEAERRAAYTGLPKTMNAQEYQSANLLDPNYWKDPAAAYDRYLKGQQTSKQQLDVDLSKYEKSAAPRKGVSFQEYLQNRSVWDETPTAPAPVPSTSKISPTEWMPRGYTPPKE
jgi:hypothetical protein